MIFMITYHNDYKNTILIVFITNHIFIDIIFKMETESTTLRQIKLIETLLPSDKFENLYKNISWSNAL